MKSRSGFSGIYAMLYALFDGDGQLSRAAMRGQVEVRGARRSRAGAAKCHGALPSK